MDRSFVRALYFDNTGLCKQMRLSSSTATILPQRKHQLRITPQLDIECVTNAVIRKQNRASIYVRSTRRKKTSHIRPLLQVQNTLSRSCPPMLIHGHARPRVLEQRRRQIAALLCDLL